MVTPLLNSFNQWLVVNDTSQERAQMILIDERGRTISGRNFDAFNVTLIGKDKVAFLTLAGPIICPRKA